MLQVEGLQAQPVRLGVTEVTGGQPLGRPLGELLQLLGVGPYRARRERDLHEHAVSSGEHNPVLTRGRAPDPLAGQHPGPLITVPPVVSDVIRKFAEPLCGVLRGGATVDGLQEVRLFDRLGQGTASLFGAILGQPVVAAARSAFLIGADIFPPGLQPPQFLEPGQDRVDGPAGQPGSLADLQPVHFPRRLGQQRPQRQLRGQRHPRA